jgi:hypothetical protein
MLEIEFGEVDPPGDTIYVLCAIADNKLPQLK